ncbi:MAG TPA: CBS domain-containing protein [Thermoplasmata archaeon]|nr:CBS domain-containing protein [Thermoplasmata archaeon]
MARKQTWRESDRMVGSTTKNLVKWVIQSDRRLVTLRCFKHAQFLGASDISQSTGRSIQNSSTALSELERMRVAEQLEPGRRTWKKYRLTDTGKVVLEYVERELSTGMFERLADEFSFRYVRDAFRLIVTEPIIVTKGMGLRDVVEKVLEDPRTRSAYVVDSKHRVVGMIALKEMLEAIEGSLSLFENVRPPARLRQRRKLTPFSVEAHMFKPVTVMEDDRIIDALEKMIEHGQEDLPVVDENGVLIGELNGFEILLLGSEVMRRQERDLETGT